MATRWFSHYCQNYILSFFLIADLFIIPSPPFLLRLIVAVLVPTACFTPYVKHFFVPFLPILTWLLTFYACKFLPLSLRPQHIFVNLLPTLEHILYGANLSELLARSPNSVLDVLAWLPYGVLHFTLPFVFSASLFWFAPPGTLPVFGRTFGYMNLAGVLTQLVLPTTPPWYAILHGRSPANYSMSGSPGGLTRIDQLMGTHIYTSTFGASPIVFGAFPSLHSGCATVQAVFLVHMWPRTLPFACAYVMWVWWSTMYLTHHYMIDLVGGSVYAFIAYFAARRWLPRVEKGRQSRWDYLGVNRVTVKEFLRSLETACEWIAVEREMAKLEEEVDGRIPLYMEGLKMERANNRQLDEYFESEDEKRGAPVVTVTVPNDMADKHEKDINYSSLNGRSEKPTVTKKVS